MKAWCVFTCVYGVCVYVCTCVPMYTFFPLSISYKNVKLIFLRIRKSYLAKETQHSLLPLPEELQFGRKLPNTHVRTYWMVLGQAAVKVWFGSQGSGGSCPRLPGTNRKGKEAGGGQPVLLTLPLTPWASVLSRTLLISPMGPWDLSLALLPSQLTALLIKRGNMASCGLQGKS